ncbi:MAG: NAD(P)-dependent oxidoreductase [Cytophagales bacterium]
MKIGIIREGKVPIDKRTPFTPQNCVSLKEAFPKLEIVVQPSKIRIILDEEYKALKIPLQEDLSDCDYIFGIKEIPIAELIDGKSYFFFSHTIKKQPANKKLLKAIIEKNCTLIDYECIRDEKGNRLVSFGYYAGIIGAYETIKMYGHRYRQFEIKSASLCFDYAEMRSYFKKAKLKPIKIALTGGGRVAEGAMQVLNQLKIKQVNIYDFLNKTFTQPVFTQIHSEHFNVKKGTQFFDKKDFYKNPEKYESHFFEFAKQADILLACAYWHPKAPLLFTKAEMRSDDFRIKVIGDITCDINGSIPSTMRSSSIDNPAYDYNPFSEDLEVPFSAEKNITVMAVDNLPCELARDASHSFGIQLISHVIGELINNEKSTVIKNATIASEGCLTEKYQYLSDYVE